MGNWALGWSLLRSSFYIATSLMKGKVAEKNGPKISEASCHGSLSSGLPLCRHFHSFLLKNAVTVLFLPNNAWHLPLTSCYCMLGFAVVVLCSCGCDEAFCIQMLPLSLLCARIVSPSVGFWRSLAGGLFLWTSFALFVYTQVRHSR